MIDKSIHYCYICEFPETPAFTANIQLMWDKIFADGGKSPSVRAERDEDGIVTGYTYIPQIGTVSNASKQLINFELPMRMGETVLLAYLTEPMTDPMPPITVHDIRSKFEIINVGTEEEPDYQREIIVRVQRPPVRQFFRVQEYDEDGNPVGPPRQPLPGEDIVFSHYAGGAEIYV